MHLDKELGELYSVQTKGGRNLDSAWRNYHENNAPLLQTYFVKDRLGEIRPIIVKAYVVPGLKYDLLSVKGLNRAGYAVNHHPDPEQSVVYAVIKNKIDKSKSFPFISEHSIFYYLKLAQMSARQFEKQSG